MAAINLQTFVNYMDTYLYDNVSNNTDTLEKNIANIDRLYKENYNNINNYESVMIYSKNRHSVPKLIHKKDWCSASELIKKEKSDITSCKDISNKKKEITINAEVNSVNDLLEIVNKYPYNSQYSYNIDLKSLHKIKDNLNDLNRMIGIKSLKEDIINQLIYFLQGFHKNNGNSGDTGDYMHTIIYGDPGTGKTEIAKILGKIYSKLGILKKETFIKVTRSDLIAGYLGQTAIKTADVIKRAKGGVLFIDEAYALGNKEKGDSFSKECIDTLCEALSDHKDNLMVIIAGYEKQLSECFFSYNPGLESRFAWRFETNQYSPEELYLIFIKKIKDINWNIVSNNELYIKWFINNKDSFKGYGRDIETFLSKTKIAHSRRIFGKTAENIKTLTLDDMNAGFKIYTNNMLKDKDKEFNTYLINTIYS